MDLLSGREGQNMVHGLEGEKTRGSGIHVLRECLLATTLTARPSQRATNITSALAGQVGMGSQKASLMPRLGRVVMDLSGKWI
jgi:hypothetical protein